MCGPNEFPTQQSSANASDGLESKPLLETPPATSSSKSSSWLTKSAIIFAFLVLAFPCLISEAIGGWTTQYTSPVMYQWSIGDQSNKVVIVTGANTGIGYETSLKLAEAGAHVVVACRSETKGLKAMERIQDTLGDSKKAQLTFLPLDLSSLQSVKEFAKKFQELKLPLHTLILNAGVMKSPGAEFVGQHMTYGFDTTQDGLEYHIGVNHVAHFYLTQLLMDNLEQSAPSRVVAVSSMAEQGSYESGMLFSEWQVEDGKMPPSYEDGQAYGQSKLANLLFAKELAQRYAHKNITAYACHPGVIQTDLSRYMEPVLEANLAAKPFFERVISSILMPLFNQALFAAEGGALTQLHLATAPTESLENGANYHPVGRPTKPLHPQGSNETLQSLVWEETERVIQQLI